MRIFYITKEKKTDKALKKQMNRHLECLLLVFVVCVFVRIAACIFARILVCILVFSTGVLTANAQNTDENVSEADNQLVIHYKGDGKTEPYIYYWNSLPTNISTTYPGKAMTKEAEANWYTYTFSDVTKINMLFIDNGVQSKELTRNTGEWFYKNGMVVIDDQW